VTGGSQRRAVPRAVLQGAKRVWHDLRVRDLYRSCKEFELMQRSLGFAALALLTVIPLLIVIAAANPAPHRGLAGWVIYGMGLTGSSADAVTRPGDGEPDDGDPGDGEPGDGEPDDA
jgi:membrane protein